MQANNPSSHIHHADRSPTPSAVRVVAEAWASSRSGVLHVGQNRIELLHGEPRDDAALQLVVDALYAHEPPRFEEGEHTDAVAPRLATELWVAASRLADRGVLKGRAQAVVKPRPALHRAAAFPLGPDTSDVLGRIGSVRFRLADTVRIEKGRRRVVLDDLVALEILDLVVIADGEASRQSKPQHSDAEQRLRVEWKAMQGADPWAVLGCNPGMGRGPVEDATQRLAEGYRRLSSDSRLSPKGRALAARVLAKVLDARAQVISAAVQVQPLGPLEQGLQELDAGRHTNAMKCFQVANQERYSPRFIAWLGFALYYDQTRDLARRQRKGRKLIEQALEEGQHQGDAGYLLAHILYEERELVRAWTYLDRVLGRFPDHSRATELRETVKRELPRT
ncbi:MAG TPA: hypothetical protein QGF58_30315 [Myxococcota bacterium]|nr:hypothetical protein [Myxococcota bacterium]